MKKTLLTLLCASLLLPAIAQAQTIPQYKHYPFHNNSYVVYRAETAPVIDGNIDTPEWNAVPWTENFRDIEGENRKVDPVFPTRAKMMWDDKYLYVAAEMIETDIWANLTNRDAVIYFDNDIELFLDVTGEGHHYYEFEFNAFGTEWDLLLTQPYFRGGTFFTGWDIKGMKSAVKLYGTVNDPSDKDDKWTFEMALPISELVAVRYGKRGVKAGEQWRANFSRVQWMKYEVIDGQYKKLKGKEGFGNEDNWVWCPTGVIDMHRPERWGYIQFSDVVAGKGSEAFNWNNDHKYREQLWIAAERIAQFKAANGGQMPTLEQLQVEKNIHLYPAGDGYKLTVETPEGKWYKLSDDGRMQHGK